MAVWDLAGVSNVGLQTITSWTGATNRIQLFFPDAAAQGYQYWGYVGVYVVSSAVLIQELGQELWYGGVVLRGSGLRAGTAYRLSVYWKQAGINWISNGRDT